MLKIIVVVIGAIAVVDFIFSVCNSRSIDEMKPRVNGLSAYAITMHSKRAHEYDMAVHELDVLKKALREQGIATDYTSERKLDFSECKKTDEEYKKEAEAITSVIKDNDENFEGLTTFEEVEVETLKDPREKQFRCKKCSTYYPINIAMQSNVKYCSYCGRKIAYFKFLDYWKG